MLDRSALPAEEGVTPGGVARLRQLIGAGARGAGIEPWTSRGSARESLERCDYCGVALPAEHGHVVDVETRALSCVCRPCYLLFTPDGAASGKRRAVPPDYRALGGAVIGEHEWDDLQIPVSVAFFFRNSRAARVVAFYPSPAGATESLLPLAAWDALVGRTPVLATMESDVQALLVRKGAAGAEAFIVPIDACYELVGRMRTRWKGFHGGEDVWRDVEGFFDGVRARCGGSATTGSFA